MRNCQSSGDQCFKIIEEPNMLTHLTIKTRLIAAFALINLLLLASTIIGLTGQYKTGQSLQTVFDDRVLPLTQLSEVKSLLLESRLRLNVSAALKNSDENAQTLKTVEDNLAALDKTWAAYMATYLTPKESELAHKFAADMDKYRENVLKPGQNAVRSGGYDELSKLLTNQNRKLFEPVGEGLEALIALQVDVAKQEYQASQDRAGTILIFAIAVCLVSICLSAWLGFSLFNAIVLPLRQAKGYFERMAKGDLNVKIQIQRQDEIAEILNTALVMQTKLRGDIAEAERKADEATRFKYALENVVTGVMIADNDRNLIYANKAVKNLLKNAEASIRKELPNFNADRLEGVNIDSFHKNPARQAQMLAHLNAAYVASLQISDRKLQVTANPIFSARGERLGTVAEWVDLTDELALRATEQKLSAENTRVKIALDNVSTGVMIADQSRTIVYVNKSVQKLLKVAEADIRKQLPNFDADRLLGVNIDGFHKNPAHQASLLENFKQPYTAHMQIGGRHLRVIANPVLSEKGERLGSVAEWTDQTLEVLTQNEVAGIVHAAAQGDFSKRADLAGKEGFFKLLAEAVNQLMEVSERGVSEVARVLGALARGDLTERMAGDYQGMFGEMKEDANGAVANLTDIIQQIKEATDAINTASKEIAMGNADLSQRTEEQASSLEETASSMEELASTVRQNADNARQANQMAVAASDVAVKGGSVVQQVVGTMSAINDSARKIVDIISVIDGIAFQTNILALNAAVEAARAGEQGRGFAVVAGEVRNLAQRSATAAKEIKSLIGDSVEKVEGGAKLVDEAGKTMNEIVTAVRRVTDIMSEISAASLEQSSGIEQVNTAITQIDEVTQQNAALVEQAAAAAESLEEQAANLSESVSRFRLDSGFALSAPARSSGKALKPAKRPSMPTASKPKPKKPAPKPAAPSFDDDDWSEF
jgi:methyl-accepting chemotaxis protein